MSSVVNKKGLKAGSIYRIALKNFVTYKEVELFPGPSLNLIIGPNGTGKSTFVCAIILGLCGKTSVIGRAKKISEYVRRGCQESTIELEIYQEPGEKNVIITRIFNIQNATTWKIDNMTVREKQVQDLIATMNIQVDNLCQLLPQDRVQDFAKMDPQELLRGTLVAVGGHESVAQLDDLIKCREEQRGLSTRLQNNGQLLEEKKRLNDRLKIVIDSMKQRKEIEEQIAMCDRKKCWMDYQETREKVMEYRKDKEMATKLVETHQLKVDPLEKVLNKAKAGISKLEQQKFNTAREVRDLKDKIKDSIKLIKDQDFALKDIDDCLLEKLEEHKNRERELIEAKAKLDKLITDKTALSEKANRSNTKAELEELQKMIAKANAAVNAVNGQKLKEQYDLENNVMPQIRLYQNKIRQLENVDEKRLEALRGHSEDTHRAVAWLRQNRQLFQRQVYEPMMLEINFTEPKFARYLEATVSSRDLLAFTFESSEDMNLFLQKVRSELGLRRVNALCSAAGEFRHKKADIQDLSYLGFYTYLADTITAPSPIMRYLCTQYGIQGIPIGNDHTFKNSSKVPAHIRLFYTENHRFSVRVSAYSGARSSSTSELRPPRLLANSLDLDALGGLRTQLAKFEHKAQVSRQRAQELDAKEASLQDNLNELNAERKRVTDSAEQLRNIIVKIRLQEKKVQDIESRPAFNMQQEKLKCRRKQRDIVMKQCRLHQELCGVMKGLQNKLLNGEMWKVKLDISRNAIVQQESELRELKENLHNAQRTLEDVSASLSRADAAARSKLLEAKKACHSNLLPHHADFPYRLQFERLPAEAARLRERRHELRTRLDCMDTDGDERTIREYNEREKEIAALESQVNSSSDVHKQIETKMKKISSKWLPPLEDLLREIDASFGEMFAKLGCAGEVKLDRAGGQEDYDRYGISILVRFRADEQLQRLTRHAQSGGERALTTAVFLMALQRRARAPFRCVDEINQGMDAINERKMFQLLVKVTTESENAQYFLLTPKLLTNLEYNSKIMVHTIMNGKHVMNYKKWKYQDFLKQARSYNESISDL